MPIFTDELDLDTLPPIIAQIAADIGVDRAEILIDQFSDCGHQVYIPIKMDGHLIAKLIGIEHADILAREHGGRYIWFAKCSTALRAQRNREIVALKAKKWKLHEIAKVSGVTVSTVCKVLHDAR